MAAVLVAIAIPVFSAQLEKSREATDIANIRSAYAEVVVTYLDNPDASNLPSITVKAQQKQQGMLSSEAVLTYQGGGSQAQYNLESVIGANALPTEYTVTITVADNGAVTPSIS